jgi:hypothetical protein
MQRETLLRRTGIVANTAVGTVPALRSGIYMPHRVRETKISWSASMSRYSDSNDRWIRHDAHLWICNDIKRFLKPGTDPADVIPALREEVASIQADLVRRRLAEQTKYSPSQPP